MRGKGVRRSGTKAIGSKKQKPHVFAQKGSPPHRRRAVLQHVRWDDVEPEQLNPLLQRRFIVGRDIMVARLLLKAGCVVPEHRHVNEQVTYVIDGALKFWIGGKEIVVRSGEVLTIPPNMPHEVVALEDTVDLDTFTPPRADWMNKEDDYLRQAGSR